MNNIEIQIITKVIELGASGVILFVIIWPVMRWMMRRSDEKDNYIKKLIENHFENDQKRNEELNSSILGFPNAVIKGLMEIYPPVHFKKQAEEIEVIYKKFKKPKK